MPVPEAVSQSLFETVRADLNPSAWAVFVKILGIHSIVGFLSTAVCDQFGMSPFQSGFSLSEYFMQFGHSVCMFLCGLLFMSLGVAAARIVLSLEEVRVFRSNAFLQVFVLCLISLGTFLALGAEVVFVFAMIWFVGSLLGGLTIGWIPSRYPSK